MQALPGALPVATAQAPIVGPLEQWNQKRNLLTPVRRVMARGNSTRDVGQRMSNCALRLGLALELREDGTGKAWAETGHFCGARLCPMCEWRRSRAWRRRLMAGLPDFRAAHPTHKPVFLTLTVRNVPLGELRETVEHLHASFKRLRECSFFPTAYWLRRTEITLGKPSFTDDLPTAQKARKAPAADWNQSGPMGSVLKGLSGETPGVEAPWCHPHLHCLLLAP